MEPAILTPTGEKNSSLLPNLRTAVCPEGGNMRAGSGGSSQDRMAARLRLLSELAREFSAATDDYGCGVVGAAATDGFLYQAVGGLLGTVHAREDG